jgi:hypothetical protein
MSQLKVNHETTVIKSVNGCKFGAVTASRGMCRCHHSEVNETMTGIQYVTDEKGRKVAVQIDLTKHRELWEDIQDVLVSRSRRHEKRIPLDKVKA